MENLPVFDVAVIVAAVGYVAGQVIELVKAAVGGRIPTEAKEPVIRLVSLLVMALCALGAGYGAEQLGLIEPGGMWLVITGTFPAAAGWFQVESRRKTAKALAKKGGLA